MNLKHLFLSSCLGLLTALSAHAAAVIQNNNSADLAWEAENTLAIANAAPATWEVRADATANASGGSALYIAGDNSADLPSSYATYALRFKTPGQYHLYVRWRGDAARTTVDANGANSYRIPTGFGDLASDLANFTVSSANNSRVPPAANTYASIREAARTFDVTQEQVDAGIPLILEIGSREWGMFLDRFVLSQNAALADADFNAIANSETSTVPQGANDTYLAWEGERVTEIRNSPPAQWTVRADATANASDGAALYISGDNSADLPSSYALYNLKFTQPGSYSLYVRWRGDAARTTVDANGANSYRIPISFGDLALDLANFTVSSANNSRVPPAANSYDWIRESARTFDVTQEQADAGIPLILKIGSREWGMFIDRFVLSQNAGLVAADLNALVNSGAVNRPTLVRATGSDTLNTVRVAFDRPIAAASVSAGAFTIAGLNVTDAALDPNRPTDVVLTTATQTAFTPYTITVTGVTDAAGTAIAPGSTVNFTSWRRSNGWVKHETYYGAGTTIAELEANPNYPNRPDRIVYQRSLGFIDEPFADNYGSRLTAFFTPPENGSYEFRLIGFAEAALYISSDESEASLALALYSQPSMSFIDSDVWVVDNMVGGSRYLLRMLQQKATGTGMAAVAVRKVGDPTPVDQLPWLGGTMVSYYVDPAAGGITFRRQPANQTGSINGRATFSVDAVSQADGKLFYQWQRNNQDIPGATRATYTTPVLTASNNGDTYRVFVGVNGAFAPSATATLAVSGTVGFLDTPYIGVSFTGGGNASIPGVLTPQDIAGVVQQGNFNNVAGAAISNVALNDANGAATPVTLSVDAAQTISIGTGEGSADAVLLQGSIHVGVRNGGTLVLRLANVPNDNYSLIVYSVGFDFGTIFHETVTLEGAATATYSVQAQDAGDYIANPVWVLMDSTDPAARDIGNYVKFENVRPNAESNLTLTLLSESPTPTPGGIDYLPPVNGFQLVRTTAPVGRPEITLARIGNTMRLTWGANAAGYRLVTRSTIVGGTWTPVAGVPNPIVTAGSTDITVPATGHAFYVLTQ